MAVVYVDKGSWLIEEIERQGHRMWREVTSSGSQVLSDDDVAVQNIIDSFDPLPYAKKEAEARVDEAAGAARARYITVAPGQEAVYTLKREQAQAYKDAGYPADASPWPLIAQEAARRNVSPQTVADEILAKAALWVQLAAAIEAVRMDAKARINAVTDSTLWQQCGAIADAAVAELEAI